jgi:hypothetical protein
MAIAGTLLIVVYVPPIAMIAPMPEFLPRPSLWKGPARSLVVAVGAIRINRPLHRRSIRRSVSAVSWVVPVARSVTVTRSVTVIGAVSVRSVCRTPWWAAVGGGIGRHPSAIPAETVPIRSAIGAAGDGRSAPCIMEAFPFGIQSAAPVAVVGYAVASVNRSIGATKHCARSRVTARHQPRIVQRLDGGERIVLSYAGPRFGIMRVATTHEDPASGWRFGQNYMRARGLGAITLGGASLL